MILRDFRLDDYLFGETESELDPKERKAIRKQLRHEMLEIFYGRNMRKVNEWGGEPEVQRARGRGAQK
jgi:S-adenosylmethionine decarboxylase